MDCVGGKACQGKRSECLSHLMKAIFGQEGLAGHSSVAVANALVLLQLHLASCCFQPFDDAHGQRSGRSASGPCLPLVDLLNAAIPMTYYLMGQAHYAIACLQAQYQQALTSSPLRFEVLESAVFFASSVGVSATPNLRGHKGWMEGSGLRA